MTPFEKATLPVNLPDYVADDAVVMNDVYQVNIRRFEAGGLGRIVHLSIKRRDKQACHDWRDFQWIKNQIVGEEFDAVEIYPAESKLVDTSNQYHLWVFLDAKLPFGFQDRMVSEAEIESAPGCRNRQRPFADFCKPADLAEQNARFAEMQKTLIADIAALNGGAK